MLDIAGDGDGWPMGGWAGEGVMGGVSGGASGGIAGVPGSSPIAPWVQTSHRFNSITKARKTASSYSELRMNGKKPSQIMSFPSFAVRL